MNLNVQYNTTSLKRLNSNSVVPAETTIKATIAIAAADIFPFKLPTVREPNVAVLFHYKTTIILQDEVSMGCRLKGTL